MPTALLFSALWRLSAKWHEEGGNKLGGCARKEKIGKKKRSARASVQSEAMGGKHTKKVRRRARGAR